MREELIEAVMRRPWVPFRITMSSGVRHDVTVPHSVAVGERIVHVMTPRSNHSKLLSMEQIKSVQTLEATP